MTDHRGPARGRVAGGFFSGVRAALACSRVAIASGAVCVALGGCQLFEQDSGRCQQSVDTVRQAISLKDFASARSWRDYTWKVCDERGIIATLDKEIVDAEAAYAAELKAAADKAKQLAQKRINDAQALWRKFDGEKPEARTREALDATRKSAKRLETGLTKEYAAKLQAYNEGEYQKRLSAIKK